MWKISENDALSLRSHLDKSREELEGAEERIRQLENQLKNVKVSIYNLIRRKSLFILSLLLLPTARQYSINSSTIEHIFN